MFRTFSGTRKRLMYDCATCQTYAVLGIMLQLHTFLHKQVEYKLRKPNPTSFISFHGRTRMNIKSSLYQLLCEGSICETFSGWVNGDPPFQNNEFLYRVYRVIFLLVYGFDLE